MYLHFKKNKTAALSLFLMVSLTLQFTPKVNALDATGFGSLDLYSQSPVAQDFVNTTLKEPLAPSNSEHIIPTKNEFIMSSDASLPLSQILANGSRTLAEPTTDPASYTSSVFEKIYAAGVEHNDNIYIDATPPPASSDIGNTYTSPVVALATEENSKDIPEASKFYCDNFSIQAASGDPYHRLFSGCGEPTDADLSSSPNAYINVNGNAITATFTRYNYPRLYSMARTTQVKYLDSKTVQIDVSPSKGTSDSFAVRYTRPGNIFSSMPGDHTNDGSLEKKIDACNSTYVSYTESGPVYSAFCQLSAVYKDGNTYFVNWYQIWSPQLINTGVSAVLPDAVLPAVPGKAGSYSVITTPSSKILWISPTRCKQGDNSYDCYTYAMSYDGRVGLANYHVGWDAGPSFLESVAAGAFIIGGFAFGLGGFGDFGLGSFGLNDVGLGSLGADFGIGATNVSFSVQGLIGSGVSNVGQAVLSGVTTGATVGTVSSLSKPVGTVETSNTPGTALASVGTWTWTPLPIVATAVTPAPNCAFSASPDSITSGDSSTLSWGCDKNTDSCSIDNGIGSVSITGVNKSKVVTPTQTTTYNLSCTGPGGNASFPATVTVTAPTVVNPSCSSFSASPSQIIEGSQSTLSWTCSNTSACTIDNGVGSVNPPANSTLVTPGNTTTYTLSCTGAGGTAVTPSPKTTVTVFKNPICVFSGSPSTIVPPQTATLSWTCSSDAKSCTIDKGIGTVNPATGSTRVSPAQNTTYTLTCLGAGNTQVQTRSSFQTTIRTTGFNIKEVTP